MGFDLLLTGFLRSGEDEYTESTNRLRNGVEIDRDISPLEWMNQLAVSLSPLIGRLRLPGDTRGEESGYRGGVGGTIPLPR